MTSLLDGARRLVGRSSDIGARLEGLRRAVEAAEGRLSDGTVDHASGVVERTTGRLRLSADHTVVALAGATGSGKSSTFNALTELEISAVGVRRPTTSWTTACVWGSDGAQELLDWLGIPPRHQVTRDSMLSVGPQDDALQGVVLLDLPDHDSTEVSHHLEVDRLVQLADMLVWVLDPQKYADAAIHDRYLAPLASHRDVMLVVLNQIDTVPEERRASMVADVERLLAADGLGGVPVLPVSARNGWGIGTLRDAIAKRAAEKKASRTRLEADLRAAARALEAESGTAKPAGLPRERVAALDDAFAEAAGVPTVVAAVEQSTRVRANRATGWPVTAWLSRLKPDPLKRLHLDLGRSGKELTSTARTSVPRTTGVQQARVDTEVRALADEVSAGLAQPWVTSIRRASLSRLGDLNDRLDRAVAATDLRADRIPGWAGAVRILQWLLILAALAGGLWLAGIAALKYLLPSTELPVPDLWGFPLPTILLVGGVVLGILLGLACRLLVGITARRRARSADRRLRSAISEVSAELVVAPVEAELEAYDRLRSGLASALR